MSCLIDIEKRLDHFTLTVRIAIEKTDQAPVLGLLGPSGSGKTMTLRCIAGIERPDRGSIIVDGKTFFDSERKIDLRPQERGCGYLFQNYALFPNMTVRQNIRCGLTGAGKRQKYVQYALNRNETEAKVSDMIRRMRLEGLEDAKPDHLSGGQQQRCALGRILVSEPEIVLLDEPFSALDEYLRDELLEETMMQLEVAHVPVIFVTHSRAEAREACGWIVILHDGEVAEEGPAEEVFAGPKTLWGRIMTGNVQKTDRFRKSENP